MYKREQNYLQKVGSRKSLTKTSSPVVKKAIRFAKKRHKNKKRKETGLPYYIHLLDCRRILVQELGINNTDMEVAALLHDTIEDGVAEKEEIAEIFGERVASIVDRLNKITDPEGYTDRLMSAQKIVNIGDEVHRQNGEVYVETLILKLIDRLSNLRDVPIKNRKKSKAEETLSIYVELAEALGIWVVKAQLEDLAFQDAYPARYRSVLKKIQKDPRREKRFESKLKRMLKNLTKDHKIDAEVTVRESSIYHLYQKLERKTLIGQAAEGDYSKVNDVISFRVIVDNIEDVFGMFGVLINHSQLSQLIKMNTIDTYIGPNARPNGYEALQLTLQLPVKDQKIITNKPDPAGRGFVTTEVEIALATQEMEEYNHLGIVSLMRKGISNIEEHAPKIAFARGRPWFMQDKSARGIDLAYLIDERFAAQVKEISINGAKADLEDVVPHGAMVEFRLSEDERRAPDKKYYTSALESTREAMNEQFRLQERDELVEKGKATVVKDLKKRGVLEFADLESHVLSFALERQFQNTAEVLYLIGKGSLAIRELSDWLDERKLTKSGLGYSSISFSGKDRPGIFARVANMVWQMGGNIENIHSSKNDQEFEMTILTTGLDKKDEKSLRNKLQQGGDFKNVEVV